MLQGTNEILIKLLKYYVLTITKKMIKAFQTLYMGENKE